MRRHFTHEEENKMLLWRLEGVSEHEMARRLGRTASSVRNRLRYMDGSNYDQGRTCGDCATKIRNDNKSGYCQSCCTARSNRSPEMKVKRVEGWKKRLSDPLEHARVKAQIKRNFLKAMSDPAKRAAQAERARKIYSRYLDTPEMRERLRSPEMRARQSDMVRERRMAWCPVEYRELYYDIRRKVQCKAAEARQIVLDQIKADEAKLSPFERQQRALERGGQIVANDTAPSLANPADYGEERWKVGTAA